MNDARDTGVRFERTRAIVLMLTMALTSAAVLAAPVTAQDESAAPSASPTAAEAACSSADDLRIIIDFIGQSVESESGLIPVGIGVVAGLSEARSLTGLVAETYRPLVDDLVVSLQDLSDTIGGLSELDTAGAMVADVGEAMVDIGNAMDALTTQLRTGCPEE